MILFVIWERYQKEPLVPLDLFRERNFSVANWIAAAISFGMLSMFLPFTIYLQSARGFSALVAGLTLAPMSLTSMVTAPFAGRLADRIGGMIHEPGLHRPPLFLEAGSVLGRQRLRDNLSRYRTSARTDRRGAPSDRRV